MKEMRVKNEYLHFKEIKAAQGIKIMANGLEDAMAGSNVYVYKNDQELEQHSEALLSEMKGLKQKIKLQKQGVCVVASTLGSLEALLAFLKQMKVPVCSFSIGSVTRDDVMKCKRCISNDDQKKNTPEYAVVLAFDVKVLPEASYYATHEGIKIFTARIIYHLFEEFKIHVKSIDEAKKLSLGKNAIFPCVLQVIFLFQPIEFFRQSNPLIIGVSVTKGILKIGTPICVMDKDVFILYQRKNIVLGKVFSIEFNHKTVTSARKATGNVAVKFHGDNKILAERDFTLKDQLCSVLTRQSIDDLKLYYRDEMLNPDWDLVRELKPILEIQ